MTIRAFLRSLSLAGLLALSPVLGWTASLQYVNPGTPVTFGDSGGGFTRTMTTNAIVTANGRVSARHDKGAGAQPGLWEWRCTFRHQGTGSAVGNVIEIYISTSDGTNEDGEAGTADAALTSTNSLLNFKQIGVVVVDKTTANADITASGQNISIPTRYFSLVYWNASGATLQNAANVSFCSMTPMNPEMQ